MQTELKKKYVPIEKNKIRLYYFLGSGSAVVILALFLGIIHVKGLYQEYQKKIDQLSSGIIREKQRFLKNTVNMTIYLIDSERNQVKKELPLGKFSQKKIDQISMKRIATLIRDLRLIDDGYVWVNHIVDYEGGEKYAIRQIHPNLPQTEGQWLSTETIDIKGNTPYKTELEGVKSKGEIFFDYYFKKLGSEKIAHKMTFAKLYKPWNWIVATGVYLDDVDTLIKTETMEMKKTLNRQILYTFLLAVLALMASVLIIVMFEKQVRRLLLAHEYNIKIYTDRLIEEKERTESALAEVKELKGLLPICSSCKKIRDDSGYWNQIESYISDHSKAEFTHGICPDCARKLYPEFYKENNEKNKES